MPPHPLKTCAGALEERGFERTRSRCVFVSWFDEDICGWLGLNCSEQRRDGGYEVYANVGVHVRPVMERFYAAIGSGHRLGLTATYSAPLSALAGGDGAHKFPAEDRSGWDAVAKRLAENVASVGLPWMTSLRDLRTLLPLLKEGVANLGGAPEIFLITLEMLDGKQAGERFIAEFIENESQPEEGVIDDATLEVVTRLKSLHALQ